MHKPVVDVDTFYIIDWDKWFRTIDEGGLSSVMNLDECADEEVPITADDLDPFDVSAPTPRGTKCKAADKETPRKRASDASPSSPTDSSGLG